MGRDGDARSYLEQPGVQRVLGYSTDLKQAAELHHDEVGGCE